VLDLFHKSHNNETHEVDMENHFAPENATPIHILFQSRPNMFTEPGGDTVVLKRLSEQLERRGYRTDFSSDPRCDVTGYDIIHLFNLTTPRYTDGFTENIHRQHKPFVVTSLQENFPMYFNKAKAALGFFKAYIEKGQLLGSFDAAKDTLNTLQPAPVISSPYTAAIANLLLTCGTTESEYLSHLFPYARITAVPFGSSLNHSDTGPELFENEFGVKDFVLCVGRLEARKNQLMLMKALEYEKMPLVFVDGGFTYQPLYRRLCEQFKRSGSTIFTGRISDEMLISAYKAARVHCLPSWYELPGLVTLEAARYGCRVIASSWGASTDYLKDSCSYCTPDDYMNIRNTVLAAYDEEKKQQADSIVQQYTWERFATKMVSIYKEIITSPQHHQLPSDVPTVGDAGCLVELVTKCVESGEFETAVKIFRRNRPFFSSLPELERFDMLMVKVEEKASQKPNVQ